MVSLHLAGNIRTRLALIIRQQRQDTTMALFTWTFRRAETALVVMSLMGIGITGAHAQAGAPSGERPVTKPGQVDPGQLNILPSAGNAGRSAAPTMIFDCKKNPAECTTPISPGDKTTKPDLSPAPPAP
jgi:hypothetical protein